MTNDPFLFEYRVRYADCTVGNHVYHSRYLDILEVARGEFMRAAGHSLGFWQERGVAFPVIDCRLRYLRPARYDDELTVEVRLVQLKGVRLTFAYVVRLQDGTSVLEGATQLVCTDLTEKPRRLPPEVREALKRRLLPDTAPSK